MMKCRYCGKQAYVTHLCPYCRKYHCLEHRDPRAHDCPSQKKPESQPTRAVTGAIKPQNNKEKKRLLTIHFTFLEGKKRSDQEQTAARTRVLRSQPPSKENQEAAFFAVRDTQREDQARPPYDETVRPPTIQEETARAMAFPAFFDSASRKLFAVSFILVVVEEVLRLVSYVQNPPFLAYLDANLYVRILNESIAPHVASLIVFVLICAVLFVTARLARTDENIGQSGFSLLKRAIPFGVYVAVSVTYIVWIWNWFFILKS